jgi:hypothetical protein
MKREIQTGLIGTILLVILTGYFISQ